jgi:hypothetical protein
MAEEPPAPPPAPSSSTRSRPAAHPGDRRQRPHGLVRLIGFSPSSASRSLSVRDLDFFSATATISSRSSTSPSRPTTFFWSRRLARRHPAHLFPPLPPQALGRLAEAPPSVGGACRSATASPPGSSSTGRSAAARSPTTSPADGLARHAFVTWLVIWLATPLAARRASGCAPCPRTTPLRAASVSWRSGL